MVGHARGYSMDPAVLAVVRTAQAGTPLLTAWRKADKPCSRSNIFKAFRSVEPPPPPKPRQSRKAGLPQPAAPPKSPKPPFKLTTKQSEQVRQQKEEHWRAYVAVHRTATVEHSSSITTGKTLVLGRQVAFVLWTRL